MMVIQQQIQGQTPRNSALATIYARIQPLRAALDIRTWHHHFRSFNRMADMAANLAMDLQQTGWYLPSRTTMQEVTQHLANDLQPWLEHHALEHEATGHFLS